GAPPDRKESIPWSYCRRAAAAARCEICRQGETDEPLFFSSGVEVLHEEGVLQQWSETASPSYRATATLPLRPGESAVRLQPEHQGMDCRQLPDRKSTR